jgi:hypothetical protein
VPPGVYEPRATTATVLHHVVRFHLDRFLAETAAGATTGAHPAVTRMAARSTAARLDERMPNLLAAPILNGVR